jgi:hypothetical protein
MDIRQTVSEEDTRHLLETIIEDVEAPSPNDAPRAWPAAQRHTIDHNRSARLMQLARRRSWTLTFTRKDILVKRLVRNFWT